MSRVPFALQHKAVLQTKRCLNILCMVLYYQVQALCFQALQKMFTHYIWILSILLQGPLQCGIRLTKPMCQYCKPVIKYRSYEQHREQVYSSPLERARGVIWDVHFAPQRWWEVNAVWVSHSCCLKPVTPRMLRKDHWLCNQHWGNKHPPNIAEVIKARIPGILVLNDNWQLPTSFYQLQSHICGWILVNMRNYQTSLWIIKGKYIKEASLKTGRRGLLAFRYPVQASSTFTFQTKGRPIFSQIIPGEHSSFSLGFKQ